MDTSRNAHFYSSYSKRPQQESAIGPPTKEIYQYDAPWPIYALDWCKTPIEQKNFRLALGSFVEDSHNKFQIISRTDLLNTFQVDQKSDFTLVAEADSYYPITKVLWEPRKGDGNRHSDLLATAGDYLRLWELVDDPKYGKNNLIHSSSAKGNRYLPQQLIKKAELLKQSDFCAPLTSFDWNEIDPSLIVTCSIDTTCTVWNVETGQAKTQLIAHDSDVYDVAFMHGSADTFASVGADGSVRLFDLRSLEHSNIIYESSSHPAARNTPSPLLRVEFNRMNSNLLATFHMDSPMVKILDVRYPSSPIAELVAVSNRSINCMSWSPTDANQIATGGDDSQVLVWNINQSTIGTRRRMIQDPLLAYAADAEVNAIAWSKATPDWVGVGFGKTIQALRV